MKNSDRLRRVSVNRNHKVRNIVAELGVDVVRLASHLAEKAGERPRIGDLGGGEGALSNFLNGKGIETYNIDPREAQKDKEHHIPGEYGEVRFDHNPHLIVAHQSIVSLSRGHKMRDQYADFNTVAGQIARDAHPEVGTVVMDSSWGVEESIHEGVDKLKKSGFKLLKPKLEPGIGGRVSMVLSRVGDLNIPHFKELDLDLFDEEN